MHKQQAINIVHETFESAFDKVRFTNFIKNLLNEPDLTDGFGVRSGQYIPDAYKGYVEKYERLGKYEDEDEKRIDILIVHLKRDTSIERARSMQRNFVAGYLQGKYGSDAPKDAALVAFVSPNGEDWRFSLVKLEVRLDANEDGKLKVTDEFTPAKRWSFLVGSQEKSHTAQRQFVPIMQDTDNNPTLAGLEEAFNIETVTKEFFNAYRALFIRTKGELDKLVKKDARVKADFESKGIDTVNLAKKLLGQIVFLYYLQKKGWFGVPRDASWGEGSRAFLRELFEKKHGEYKNFFNDVLEPLFYEALRIDRSHDDHYYSRFDCKIPFLNGGLFDPMNNYDWVKTDLLLPNELFSNRGMSLRGRSPKQSAGSREVASQSALATTSYEEGDGILDVFDLYNFTVKEDEPFEKEVAIDPELLGKAYEKFNAIRPDNYAEFLKALESGKKGEESKFNKQYGVYYTPREIVHYMCQQSLINYLFTEVSGDTVSGVREVPTKEEIALLIQHGENWRENEEQVLAKGKETRDYKYKIPESIRMNASLLDEKLAAIKVCDPAVGSGAFPVGMMSEIVKARDVLTTFVTPPIFPENGGMPAKRAGGRSVYQFKRECIENSLYGVDIDSGAVEIAKLRLWLSLVVDEDDPQNIKPLPNLDYKVVCGNSLIGFPENWGSPIEKEIEMLIRQHFNETKVSKKNELKTKIDEKIESRYKNSLRAFGYQVNFDFKTVFSEVFQRNGGFDVVIGNPPYETSRSEGIAAEFKTYLKTNYETAEDKYDYYVFFIEKSSKISKPNGVLSLITPSSYLLKPLSKKVRKFLVLKHQIIEIIEFKGLVFEAVVPTAIITFRRSLAHSSHKILAKFDIGDLKDFLTGEYKENFAIQNSFNKQPDYYLNVYASRDFFGLLEKLQSHKDAIKLGELAEIYNGIQTGDDKKYVSKTKSSAQWQEVIVGSDINKYYKEWGGKYVYYVPSKLHSNTREDIFRTKEKIIIRQTSDRIIGTYDDKGYLTLASTFIIKQFEKKIPYKVLLAILNSNLFLYLYRSINNEAGRVLPQIKKKHIFDLPIILNGKEETLLTSVVERVLAAKGKNPQADTSKEESAIDELVYELYGLTEEEIRIVEGEK